MTQEKVPNPSPNTERRNRLFKVEITETWSEYELRKEWHQVLDYRRPLAEGEKDHAYVETVLPTEHKRTVLEAELEQLDVPHVVLAVFGLIDSPRPQVTMVK